MRAMRLAAPAAVESSPLALEELPDPEPGPGELLLRVEACGVCRTDLHVVEGELPVEREGALPLTPGHMVVGRVEAVGAGVAASRVGRRMGIAWLRSVCGRCEWCREGRENLCPEARFTGYHADGGYAERATVPEAFAYPLTDELPAVALAPLHCAGIIGYRALRLSGVGPGERLGLVGFGNSAHLVLQVARARGCEVVVASHREEHRALARSMGAVWTGDTADLPEASLHGAILFAPVGELVPPVLRALRPAGTLACAGIHMSPIPTIDYDTELFHERVLRSVTANTRADGQELLREATELELRPETTTWPLERANEALQALKAGEVRGAAVLTVE